ncbi:hypothetical protein AWRI1631_90120 [Saccharomyces cerevisiae AWRI1631]|uniref:Uncharacterized protein n=1 Tax=Saccharomyces cerevisiae (strain AWRI1631) TaxID=545124 RepID=B5VKF5_YEAS6|nr:hypothetical protein AWRI1631_90120 [Saccharomyces cerevisiae AWRI1631]
MLVCTLPWSVFSWQGLRSWFASFSFIVEASLELLISALKPSYTDTATSSITIFSKSASLISSFL